MSTGSNKAVVYRFFNDCVNAHNLDAGEKLVTEGFVSIYAGMPETNTREAFKALGSAYFKAFPDMHLTIHDMIAEGDWVAMHYTWTGTNRGEFMGMPPTNRQVTSSGMGFYRVENSLLAEQRVCEDMLGLLQQLGVVPPPPEA
jgi:steroid delta-isomerase-like uncharacterized protein